MHDINDPVAVSKELHKEFPPDQLEMRNGLTYIPYPFVVNRLIEATGNCFDVDCSEPTVHPWKDSKSGKQYLVMAKVTLSIPVFGTSRAAHGFQIGQESEPALDLWKGAVSDGLKKAAQMYGVGLYLTGAYDETLRARDLVAASTDVADLFPKVEVPESAMIHHGDNIVPRPTPSPNGSAPAPNIRPMSDKQKHLLNALMTERNISDTDVEDWLSTQKYKETWPNISSPMASRLISAIKEGTF